MLLSNFYLYIFCLQLIRITDDLVRCEHPTHTSWLIFKLFRLRATDRAWTTLLQQFEPSHIRSVSISLAFITLLFFHWVTYINFQVPTIYAHLFPHDFRKWYKRLKITSSSETTLLEKYLRNLYHVCVLCIGYSAIDIDVIPEMIVTSFIGLIGLLFNTYAFTGKMSVVLIKSRKIVLGSPQISVIPATR